MKNTFKACSEFAKKDNVNINFRYVLLGHKNQVYKIYIFLIHLTDFYFNHLGGVFAGRSQHFLNLLIVTYFGI